MDLYEHRITWLKQGDREAAIGEERGAGAAAGAATDHDNVGGFRHRHSQAAGVMRVESV